MRLSNWQKNGYGTVRLKGCVMSIDERSTLVYSTGVGRIKQEAIKPRPKTDGIVRILLKRFGGGKVVSSITGLSLNEAELKELASALKRKCGVGGSVKDFCIEIQGDKREIIKSELEKLGYKVKLAGG